MFISSRFSFLPRCCFLTKAQCDLQLCASLLEEARGKSLLFRCSVRLRGSLYTCALTCVILTYISGF